MEEKTKKRLGEILLEDGLLTRESLEEALCHQKNQGGLIGQILIQLGYLSEEQLVGALGRQLHIPYIPLSNYAVNMDAINLLGENFCRQHGLVAFDCDDERIYVAVSDPLNSQCLEEIQKRHKLKPQVFISTPTEIMNLCDLAFSRTSAKPGIRKAAG